MSVFTILSVFTAKIEDTGEQEEDNIVFDDVWSGDEEGIEDVSSLNFDTLYFQLILPLPVAACC